MLYLHYNQIKEIPISLVNLRELKNFTYNGYQIENIHPIIQRFLNRMYIITYIIHSI